MIVDTKIFFMVVAFIFAKLENNFSFLLREDR